MCEEIAYMHEGPSDMIPSIHSDTRVPPYLGLSPVTAQLLYQRALWSQLFLLPACGPRGEQLALGSTDAWLPLTMRGTLATQVQVSNACC